MHAYVHAICIHVYAPPVEATSSSVCVCICACYMHRGKRTPCRGDQLERWAVVYVPELDKHIGTGTWGTGLGIELGTGLGIGLGIGLG